MEIYKRLAYIALATLTITLGCISTSIYYHLDDAWRFLFLFLSIMLISLPATLYWVNYFKFLFFHKKYDKVKRVYIACIERKKFSLATKIYQKYSNILLQDNKTMLIAHMFMYFKN